jgi:hypothetical protein
MLDDLYAKDLLDKSRFFDARLEVDFYELWHHEGRRARMGTAMMAPDYAWWHGFYELKKRYNVRIFSENSSLFRHQARRGVNIPNNETVRFRKVPGGRAS